MGEGYGVRAGWVAGGLSDRWEGYRSVRSLLHLLDSFLEGPNTFTYTFTLYVLTIYLLNLLILTTIKIPCGLLAGLPHGALPPTTEKSAGPRPLDTRRVQNVEIEGERGGSVQGVEHGWGR